MNNIKYGGSTASVSIQKESKGTKCASGGSVSTVSISVEITIEEELVENYIDIIYTYSTNIIHSIENKGPPTDVLLKNSIPFFFLASTPKLIYRR